MVKLKRALPSARKKISEVYSVSFYFSWTGTFTFQYKGYPLDLIKMLIRGYFHKKLRNEFIS